MRSIADNPNRKGMLFAGTGHAFYYSLDDGAHWTQLQSGLPAAPVSWIVVQKQYHDVVVSTYGRGLYILDDVTPLEQQTAANAAALQLFAPRSGFRVARSGRAQFNFTLNPAPADPVKVEILDARGAANDKAKRELGWTPAHPSWRQGFAATYSAIAQAERSLPMMTT